MGSRNEIGQGLRERQFINTSLFHLSTCIMNLAKVSKTRKTNNLTEPQIRKRN